MHRWKICKYIIIVLVIVHQGASFQLEAVYSQFSGLVTDGIAVGSNRQPLRLTLDFTSGSHLLFDSKSCPQFVTCFDPSKSVTYSTTRRVQTLAHLGMSGLEARDEIDVGDDGLTELQPFVYVSRWNSETSRLKEVAGVIGAGTESAIFSETILAISDALPSFNGIEIGAVSWRVADLRTDVLVPMSILGGTWQSPVLLTVRGDDGGGILPASLEIDPSVEDLIIPESLKSVFLSKMMKARVFAVANDGYLHVNCSESSELDPRLEIALRFSSVEISLMRSILVQESGGPSVFTDSKSGYIGLTCLTRIRFSKDTTNVKIGRLLIRSVKTLYLSYASRLMGFEKLTTDSPMRRPASNSPLIPLYGHPIFSKDDEGAHLTIKFPQTNGGNLILASVSSAGNCWTFYRTSPESVEREIELPGVFRAAKLRVESGMVSIRLSPDGSSRHPIKAFIKMRNRSVQACLKEDGFD